MATAASAMRAEVASAAPGGGESCQREFHRIQPGRHAVSAQAHDVPAVGRPGDGRGNRRTGHVTVDPTPFRTVYDPSHPAADANGYVKLPNVSEMVEVADMREAERSYEANLASLSQARSMIAKTLDISEGMKRMIPVGNIHP